MTEAVAFPDVEGLVVTYLGSVLTEPVSTRVPKQRPSSFVRVVRVGGTRRDLVTDSALVVVEAWASSETAAADLGRRARAYVGALAQSTVNGDYVRRVQEIGGLQAYPDPLTETPRYQFTVQIDTRGVAL